MHRLPRILFLSSLLLTLSGCGIVGPRVTTRRVPKEDVLAPWVHIAHLVDVPPAPGLDIVSVNYYEQGNGSHYYLTLAIQSPLEDVITFYHAEMDSLGWQEVMVSSRPDEFVMIFLKPSRICTLHAEGSRMRIVVAPNSTYIPEKILAQTENY